MFDILTNKTKSQVENNTQITASKIVIIEDDKTLGDALEIKLQQEGFLTFRAYNGEEGINLINAQKPNLILLDLMMPVMDGVTMLRKLRVNPVFKDLPVIVLTNAGTVDNMKETKFYQNAKDFFIKANTNPDVIVNRIKELVVVTKS